MDRYMLTGFLLPRPPRNRASPQAEDDFYRNYDPKPLASVLRVFSVASALAILAVFLNPSSH